MSMYQHQITYTKEYPDGSTERGVAKFISKETANAVALHAEGSEYLGFGNPFIARDCKASKIK